MRLRTNEYENSHLEHMALPNGWNITEYMAETASADEQAVIQSLSDSIRQYLPKIVASLHKFIDVLLSDYNIIVQESYIEVDEQATFHITILLGDHDYHSPELVAARLHIPEYIHTVDGNISTHLKFSVAEEYHRLHITETFYKLRYVYKNNYAA